MSFSATSTYTGTKRVTTDRNNTKCPSHDSTTALCAVHIIRYASSSVHAHLALPAFYPRQQRSRSLHHQADLSVMEESQLALRAGVEGRMDVVPRQWYWKPVRALNEALTKEAWAVNYAGRIALVDQASYCQNRSAPFSSPIKRLQLQPPPLAAQPTSQAQSAWPVVVVTLPPRRQSHF
ncbi:hypothetical protein D9756_010167 [Leucocoprinus leucothites]|uniref:Uncharacterized protein n=1 Tax=Leucocoprinus leucothites TaxID=201217 RepID=A0A8H5CTZ0_9AGAR|nr:hypothetical protein D9756_010167 [Leucoagaricus leucothites]